jgi:hypothetical protein
MHAVMNEGEASFLTLYPRTIFRFVSDARFKSRFRLETAYSIQSFNYRIDIHILFANARIAFMLASKLDQVTRDMVDSNTRTFQTGCVGAAEFILSMRVTAAARR